MLKQAIRREYLSEAFHSVSQPLTALQCGLELAMAVPRSQKDYERRIGEALLSVNCLRHMAAGLRELAEAEDTGEDAEKIRVVELFSACQSEFENIAEIHESRLEVSLWPEQVEVYASSTKLLKLLLFLSDEVARSRGVLRIGMQAIGKNVEITVECEGTTEREGGPERTWDDRVREIRMSAADNYIATLGGALQKSPGRFKLLLPLMKS